MSDLESPAPDQNDPPDRSIKPSDTAPPEPTAPANAGPPDSERTSGRWRKYLRYLLGDG